MLLVQSWYLLPHVNKLTVSVEDRFPWSLLGYPKPLNEFITSRFSQCLNRIPSFPAQHIPKPTSSCSRVLGPRHAQTTHTQSWWPGHLSAPGRQTRAPSVTAVAESTLQHKAVQNNSPKCAHVNLQLRGMHLHLTRHTQSTQQNRNGPWLQRHSFPASLAKLNIGTESPTRFLQSSSASKQKALVQIKRNLYWKGLNSRSRRWGLGAWEDTFRVDRDLFFSHWKSMQDEREKGSKWCHFSQYIHSELGTTERAAPCSGTRRISAAASEEGFGQS